MLCFTLQLSITRRQCLSTGNKSARTQAALTSFRLTSRRISTKARRTNSFCSYMTPPTVRERSSRSASSALCRRTYSTRYATRLLRVTFSPTNPSTPQPCSGIWQTVSLEAVPSSDHITDILLFAAADGTVNATITTTSNTSSTSAQIAFLDPGDASQIVFSTNGTTNAPFSVVVEPAPQTWSPDTPVVYNVSVTVGNDVAYSYTAFRTVERKEVNGVQRFLLNGEPIYQFGPLDQGYWPDGLHSVSIVCLERNVELTLLLTAAVV